MRVAVVVAAMLFCMPVFAQGVKLPSVTNSIGMELIEIPAGKFAMGSPEGEKGRYDNEAQVLVTLTKPFGLGKTEVTQGQWKEVMGTEPWDGELLVQADKDCPATYVSKEDAKEFCEKLTAIERKSGKLKAGEEYRLPTEAEWEYSCRAGTTTAFSFGNDKSKLGDYAWWGGLDADATSKGEHKAGPGNAASEQYAHKVGLMKPNPWGLHDMHGNVWEWCSDWYGEALSGGTDPVGPNGGSNRVFRGGSWWHNPGSCRSAFRYSVNPSFRNNHLGFRVARSQSETVTRPVMEKRESVTNSIGMEVIEIPAGKFTMGSPKGEKNRQAHEAQVAVTLTQSFGLGKTEVTRGQWKNVMGSENMTQEMERYRAQHLYYPKSSKSYDDFPATNVSFFEAVEFCDALTEVEHKAGKLKADEEYRLPTEAEWEYACRAGTDTAFSFGDESKLNAHAWWGGLDLGDSLKGNKKTADESLAPMLIKTLRAGPGNAARERATYKVGSKKPNPWGLHDMHGNVSEWCSDCYGVLLGGIDPVGQNEGLDRVLRGGGWWNGPGFCRSATRNGIDPSFRSDYLGFRVARSQSAQ